MDRNTVRANGRVVSVKRISKDRSAISIFTNDGRETFPRFITSPETADTIARNHTTHVTIKGHIEGDYTETSSGGLRIMHTLVADEVSEEETLLKKEFGIKGKFYSQPSNLVILSGTLMNIEEKENYLAYTIKTETKEGENLISASWKKPDRIPETCVGSRICAVCKISTIKKGSQGAERIYQNIVVLDLAPLAEEA